MNRIVIHIASTYLGAGVCTSRTASHQTPYQCSSTESYPNGLQEIQLMQRATAAHLGVAVEFIRTQRGVDCNTALRQVMRYEISDKTRIYDDQLTRACHQISQTTAPAR